MKQKKHNPKAPSTYTKIYMHLVMVVKFRRAQIHESWEERLHKYITQTIQNRGHIVVAINGMPDHLHVLFLFKPVEDLSNLVKSVKIASTKLINENRLTRQHFRWQPGYGAFSLCDDRVEQLTAYILNQKEHHRKKSLQKEYMDILVQHRVEFEEKYLFDWSLGEDS
jgi:REP element-mobilizing transposase RayT